MSLPSISCCMLLILAAVPWSARAQPPQERPVSFGAVGGLSAASGTGGATIGATVAFDVAPRIGLEIRGAWLDRGAGSSASEVTGSEASLAGLEPAPVWSHSVAPRTSA
jgi:hypothetical protein